MHAIVREEETTYVLHRAIVDGTGCIGELREWISAKYPQGDPLFKESRAKMGAVLQWYISLSETWNTLLQKPV